MKTRTSGEGAGDVRVGTIGECAGVPVDVDQWHWSCGFYPGCGPDEHQHGTAPDFFTAGREATSTGCRSAEPPTDAIAEKVRFRFEYGQLAGGSEELLQHIFPHVSKKEERDAYTKAGNLLAA